MSSYKEKPDSDKFLRVNDTQVLNVDYIRWIKYYDKCYYVCAKNTGCSNKDTIPVCLNDAGFKNIQKLFDETQ